MNAMQRLYGAAAGCKQGTVSICLEPRGSTTTGGFQ